MAPIRCGYTSTRSSCGTRLWCIQESTCVSGKTACHHTRATRQLACYTSHRRSYKRHATHNTQTTIQLLWCTTLRALYNCYITQHTGHHYCHVTRHHCSTVKSHKTQTTIHLHATQHTGYRTCRQQADQTRHRSRSTCRVRLRARQCRRGWHVGRLLHKSHASSRQWAHAAYINDNLCSNTTCMSNRMHTRSIHQQHNVHAQHDSEELLGRCE